VQVRREVSLFDRDLARDTRLIGEVLAPAVQRIWRNEGRDAALHFLDEIDRHGGRVRVRWLAPGTREIPAEPLEVRDDRAQLAYLPVNVGGGRAGLEISEGLDEERAYVGASVRNTIVSTLVIVGLCAIAAAVLGAVFVGQPARVLVEKARRVGAGDLRQDPTLPQRDELGELSAEMNVMCARLAQAADNVRAESAARLKAMEQLRHADRLMTVGKLASGVAHELGTPLNIVDGRAQMIADGELETESAVRDNARIIAGQAQRMAKIIRQLMDFARRGGTVRDDVDVRPLAAATVELLAPAAQRKSVKLELAAPADQPVVARVNEAELAQVLTNILVNALHATDRGGRITVEIDQQTLLPPPDRGGPVGTFVCLAVKDTGAGMDAATLEHVFEPFFTTKGVGEGTGLGLSVAYGIIRDHGGWIAVASQPGAGSSFSVYLPVGAAAGSSLGA
jgi:signal transduction histidine kinase